jgi:hypothetical protein
VSEAGSSRVGGRPTAPEGFRWPRCGQCQGPLQFIAQIDLADADVEGLGERQQLLLLFQCQNRPGLCDEWDPASGGNAAILVRSDVRLQRVDPPTVGPSTLLPREDGLEFRPYVESQAGRTPDDAYCQALDADPNGVIGKAAGRPLWIQGDETPVCSCGSRMRFVVQVEQHAGGGINFGDAGVGYAFVCEKCRESARYLFQSG